MVSVDSNLSLSKESLSYSTTHLLALTSVALSHLCSDEGRQYIHMFHQGNVSFSLVEAEEETSLALCSIKHRHIFVGGGSDSLVISSTNYFYSLHANNKTLSQAVSGV